MVNRFRLIRNIILIGGMGLGFCLVSVDSGAQSDYPAKQIQILTPFAPGSAQDLSARIFAPYLSENLKQPVVVVNKPGGGSVVGMTAISRSKPDGYTLGNTSSLWVLAFLTKKVDYTIDSFIPIHGIAKTTAFLLVRKDARWKGFKEFIEEARNNPGKLKYSSYGVGGTGHLAMMDISKRAGVQLSHVPFAGAGDALTALIGGHVDLSITYGTAGHLSAGTIRALAVADKERYEPFPEIPTLPELGYPIGIGSIYAIIAPKGVPKDCIDKLSRACAETARIHKQLISAAFEKNELSLVSVGGRELGQMFRDNHNYFKSIWTGVKID